MNKKIVLQGIDNFKKLIDSIGYYVDKTFLIKELIDEAIAQIKEKKYKEGVHKVHGHENIVCIGIGFKGKELKMLVEK